MNDGQVIVRYIDEVKRSMAEIAESAMLRPELHDHAAMAKTAGVYQGLSMSLEILDAILSDKLEMEKLA
jgi:hypothetical protein